MNFFKYLESRFVSSQIAINNKQVSSATTGVAQNKAFRAWMWVCLQIMTIWHVLLVPAHYVGVALHLIAPPKTAAQLMQDEQEKQKRSEEFAKKLSDDLLKGAMQERAAAGLDELPGKGSA